MCLSDTRCILFFRPRGSFRATIQLSPCPRLTASASHGWHSTVCSPRLPSPCSGARLSRAARTDGARERLSRRILLASMHREFTGGASSACVRRGGPDASPCVRRQCCTKLWTQLVVMPTLFYLSWAQWDFSMVTWSDAAGKALFTTDGTRCADSRCAGGLRSQWACHRGCTRGAVGGLVADE